MHPIKPTAGVHNKNSSITRWFLFLGCVISLTFFCLGDVINIGRPGQSRDNGIIAFHVMYSDLALLCAASAALICDKWFFRLLFNLRSGIVSLVVISSIFLGIVSGNEVASIGRDLRVMGWVLGGIAFYRLALLSQKPYWILFILVVVYSTILHLSALNPGTEAVLDFGTTRSCDQILFDYSCGLLIPTAILLMVSAPHSWTGLTVCILLIGFHVYDGVVLAATRSILINISVLVASSCVILTVMIPTFHIIPKSTARITSFVRLILGLIFSVGLYFTLHKESALLGITQRFQSDSGGESTATRLMEVKDFLSNASLQTWTIGGGVGAMFRSVLGYDTYFLHIGVFTLFLKFGFLVFAFAITFLYLYLPYKGICAIRAIRKHPVFTSNYLIVLPGILAWLSLFIVSGGYSVYATFSLGIAFAFWKTNPLPGILKRKRKTTLKSKKECISRPPYSVVSRRNI